MINLSEMIPNALIRINNGIGFFTLGISTTIWLLEYFSPGATIFTDVYLIGLELSSETECTSHEKLYISSSLYFLT